MSTYPIVGMHYRPPAKAIIQCLPAGALLKAIPEPDNPYDPHAIKVTVAVAEELPKEQEDELANIAQPYGYTLEEILWQNEWHLGYIPKETALHLAPLMAGRTWTGNLGFNAKGAPTITIMEPSQNEE